MCHLLIRPITLKLLRMAFHRHMNIALHPLQRHINKIKEVCPAITPGGILDPARWREWTNSPEQEPHSCGLELPRTPYTWTTSLPTSQTSHCRINPDVIVKRLQNHLRKPNHCFPKDQQTFLQHLTQGLPRKPDFRQKPRDPSYYTTTLALHPLPNILSQFMVKRKTPTTSSRLRHHGLKLQTKQPMQIVTHQGNRPVLMMERLMME